MISLAYLNKKLELLRVHTDAFGYDLILKVDDVIKYVQLKSRVINGRANYWDVHKSLLSSKQGVVLVVFYSLKDKELQLTYNYLDFNKYDETIGAGPKQKKDTSKYCKVSNKNLITLRSIDELVDVLFFKP